MDLALLARYRLDRAEDPCRPRSDCNYAFAFICHIRNTLFHRGSFYSVRVSNDIIAGFGQEGDWDWPRFFAALPVDNY
jgi:hypothetical protein